MQRRTLLKSLPAVTVPVALAGCGESMPDKQCEGHCELLEEWTWEWSDNGALQNSTLDITFIPVENAPPLEIEFRGYDRGVGDATLSYATTYTVENTRTIIEEWPKPIEAAQIEVTATNES